MRTYKHRTMQGCGNELLRANMFLGASIGARLKTAPKVYRCSCGNVWRRKGRSWVLKVLHFGNHAPTRSGA